jgi:hypothetical protein
MPKPENIEPHKFKKGQSGNPNGRPKKLPELDKLLADVLGEEKDGVSAGEAILRALRAKATKGDVRAAEVLLDRAYGKAKQHIENNITTTTPLVITLDKSELNSEADSSI